MYRRCDLVLLPYPYTDLSATKRRPVLLLTDPDTRGDFLAVQVTSQGGHESALLLHDADLSLGKLPKTSYVRPEKLFTLNTSLIVHRAGRFSEDHSGGFALAFVHHWAAIAVRRSKHSRRTTTLEGK